MFAMFLLLAAADPFAQARADISLFCKQAPACVSKQRRELGHFVNMTAAFKDPRHATALRCMKAGKTGKYVDWTITTPCMRRAVSGRRIGG
jgi:hypothetical protein